MNYTFSFQRVNLTKSRNLSAKIAVLIRDAVNVVTARPRLGTWFIITSLVEGTKFLILQTIHKAVYKASFEKLMDNWRYFFGGLWKLSSNYHYNQLINSDAPGHDQDCHSFRQRLHHAFTKLFLQVVGKLLLYSYKGMKIPHNFDHSRPLVSWQHLCCG